MKLKAFEAHNSCGHFAPKKIKIGSLVKKLSPKNRRVAIKFVNKVYIRGIQVKKPPFYKNPPCLS